MNFLRGVFHDLRQRGELALIPYQTAGFPGLEESIRNLDTLVEHGADILELGVPFSDPMADGPTIQHSSQVALANGVTLADTLVAVRAARAADRIARPLVLMSYLNPLIALAGAAESYQPLFSRLREAGVNGVIIPDLPIHEADPWLAAARSNGIAIVFLVAPTSPDARIMQVAERTDAFVYAVSVTGVTGARSGLSPGLPGFLRRIRALTDKPIVVGFGISTPEQIRELHGLADGVVVASRIIEAIRRGEDWPVMMDDLKAATRPGD